MSWHGVVKHEVSRSHFSLVRWKLTNVRECVYDQGGRGPAASYVLCDCKDCTGDNSETTRVWMSHCALVPSSWFCISVALTLENVLF